MKKIILLLVIISVVTGVTNVSAQTTSGTVWSSLESTKRVNAVGQKILGANKLPAQVKFIVDEQDDVNAYANIDNEVHVYVGLLKFVENDEELAAVISHEIGHIINNHCQKQTILGIIVSPISSIAKKPIMSNILDKIGLLSLMKVSRSDEYEADLTGADLMIGSGYNPLAMVSVLNKICGNYFDIISSHPSGDKRLVNVYDYLNYNYPRYISMGYNTKSYLSFKEYMSSILADRAQNPKKMAEYNNEQRKLREKRLEKAAKVASGQNAWGTSFNVLKTVLGESM